MIGTVLVGLAALLPPAEAVAEARGARVGRVLIEGHTDTPDRFVLEQLRLFPGSKVRAAAVRDARARLRALGAFRTATVELLPGEFDGDFLDVRVRVAERPGNWLVFGLWELAVGAADALAGLDPGPLAREWAHLRERWRAGTR